MDACGVTHGDTGTRVTGIEDGNKGTERYYMYNAMNADGIHKRHE